MAGSLPGEEVKMNFHKSRSDFGIANVPGVVFADLCSPDRIDDPHIRRKAMKEIRLLIMSCGTSGILPRQRGWKEGRNVYYLMEWISRVKCG